MRTRSEVGHAVHRGLRRESRRRTERRREGTGAGIARLNELGITDYQWQPGDRDGQFLFRCRLVSRRNPRMMQRFEAEAAEPLQALEKVLAQIDEWPTRRAPRRRCGPPSAKCARQRDRHGTARREPALVDDRRLQPLRLAVNPFVPGALRGGLDGSRPVSPWTLQHRQFFFKRSGANDGPDGGEADLGPDGVRDRKAARVEAVLFVSETRSRRAGWLNWRRCPTW